MPMSSYLKDKVVNIALSGGQPGATAFKVPSIWIALYLGNPNVAVDVPEVTGGGYARILVPQTAEGGFSSESMSGISSLNSSLEFPRALTDWGLVTYVGLVDSASGPGNLLFYGTMTNHVSGVTISTDEIFRLQAGELVVTLV